MSWAIGYDTNWKRDIGYGVPAKCDHPKCNRTIDRGLSYVCGGQPFGGDNGCGLYFCDKHLYYAPVLGEDHVEGEDIDDDTEYRQCCERCRDRKEAFEPKPDVKRWKKHKLNHASWAEWREENPEWVKENTVPSA